MAIEKIIEGNELVFMNNGIELERFPIVEKTKTFIKIHRLAGSVTTQKIPMSQISS